MKTPQASEQQVQEHLPSVAITNIRRGQEELLGVADRVKGRGSGVTFKPPCLTRDSMNIVNLRLDRRPLFGIC